MPGELPEYLSLSALAVHASVSRNTLKKWMEYGMPYYRIGRCIRVKLSEFHNWLKQFSTGTTPKKKNLDAVWREVMKEA
jgi:excisionase family DNA binding protein